MDIYIQSSGISKDYSWLKIGVHENDDNREDPPIPTQFTDLIYTNDHSIVLGRFQGKLILLVTGLKTSERADNRNRPIRNSVAWVGDASDEAIIKSLTVQALRDELQQIIDKAVKSGGENGFIVLPNEREKLKPNAINQGKSPADSTAKFEELSPENQEKLAKELEQITALPKQKLLVVVTGIRKNSYLEAAGVWRGLSSLIDKHGTSETKQLRETEKSNQKFPFGNFFKNSKIVLSLKISFLIAFILSLVLGVFLFQQWKLQNQETENIKSQIDILQKQQQEIDQQIQELQRQRQEIDKQIENLELLIGEKHTFRISLKPL
ncbi:hypothetical protein [Anabaena sp. CA = ATCC 33047]|uniref:hypothetical protein n=1 Tax=Anabaena sp. (strain CA / ATCC 33047) TaxID=52271 RepID=UPI00083170D2|nr:hypothetical protein [Anabaena sp. CA = ATCC 33047]